MGASGSHGGLGPVGFGALGAVCCGAVEIRGVLGCWTLKTWCCLLRSHWAEEFFRTVRRLGASRASGPLDGRGH
jgi:hypothetical protein